MNGIFSTVGLVNNFVYPFPGLYCLILKLKCLKLLLLNIYAGCILCTGFFSINTGIGYDLAKGLARMGAHVIIACRSEQRATEVWNPREGKESNSLTD